jgi:hypothetical protein
MVAIKELGAASLAVPEFELPESEVCDRRGLKESFDFVTRVDLAV